MILVVTETMMPVNGIQVCVETFGERTEPPLLLLAGEAASMDWWDDEFCRRLAAGGRFVVRYDHRDTGRSTAFPLGDHAYSAVDLMNDALGVLDALGVRAAHLVGICLGGGLAQRIAAQHPERVLTLTLMSTSAGPGLCVDPGLGPDSGLDRAPGSGLDRAPGFGLDRAPGSGLDRAPGFGLDAGLPSAQSTVVADTSSEVDWSDRKAAVAGLIAEVRAKGGPFTADDFQLRRFAERVYDRSGNLAAGRHNHRLAGFGPPVRNLLSAITVPTVVLHGTLDQQFPAPHPEELARTIPGARLVWLEGVGHEAPPRAVWDQVLTEILRTPT
jgi:pimeloyl-ACP methyl ester carboxylesterase